MVSIWIITNGRRGDIVQCRAVAERLSDNIVEKTVAPRAPYRWLMPYGPCDPAERSLFSPPFPDLIIASGRRTVPYLHAIKRQSGNKTRIILMKYPGCDVSSLGLMWLPTHDRRKGASIITTLTAPHLVTKQRLSDHRAKPQPALDHLPHATLAILLGGNTRHVVYDSANISAICQRLAQAAHFSSFMVTTSRRTPKALIQAIRTTLAGRNTFIFDDHSDGGNNPYFDILARADAFLVTGDSHNLVSEALAAGRPVHVVIPSRIPAKFLWTLDQLEERQLITSKNSPILPGTSIAYDETGTIVKAIERYLAASAT